MFAKCSGYYCILPSNRNILEVSRVFWICHSNVLDRASNWNVWERKAVYFLKKTAHIPDRQVNIDLIIELSGNSGWIFMLWKLPQKKMKGRAEPHILSALSQCCNLWSKMKTRNFPVTGVFFFSGIQTRGQEKGRESTYLRHNLLIFFYYTVQKISF